MTFRYPLGSLGWDYARSALGTLACGLPLFSIDLSPVVSVVFATLTLLFAGYGVQTLHRHRSAVDVTPEALILHPRGVRIEWRQITRFSLSYFSLRREGGAGWMELKVQAGPTSAPAVIRLDSRIEGFGEIVRLAADAAGRASLELDATTVSNLANLTGVSTVTTSGPVDGADRSSPA